MKKLIIGRNNTCDIIIPDTSDLVSRKHAILDYHFWGKMVIHDISSNGTYVNDQKTDKKGTRVTRNDKVTFSRVAKLEWDDVKDPYRHARLWVAVGAFVIVAAFLLFAIFFSTGVRFGNFMHLC